MHRRCTTHPIRTRSARPAPMAERGAVPQRLRRPPPGAGADPLVHLAAAARRLPGAGQPAVVHARAARAGRAGRARDAGRGHRADQARLGVAGAPARAVPAPGHRGRRRAPLARLLADLRPRARRRLHLDHAQARRRRQGLAVPVQRRAPRRDRAAGRRRRHVRAARPAARAAAVHQRRQRDHADHEHAARARRATGELEDVVHVHSARTAERGRSSRASCASWPQRHPGYRLHERIDRRAGAPHRRSSWTSCAPTGASARRSCAGRPGCSRRWASAGSSDGDPARLHVEHFQPDEHVGDGERGAGGTIRFCSERRARPSATASSRSSWPASRPARRCPTAVAWASATPASGGCARARSATCAPAASTASPAKCCAPASTRPRARSRSSSRPLRTLATPATPDSPHCTTNETDMATPTAMRHRRRAAPTASARSRLRGDREPPGPPQRRADRAARPRVRRDPRRGLRRPRRARLALHPLDDQAAPPARARRPRAAARLALQAAVARRHGRAVAGEDPREHGDRPQRHARPVGLDERPRHQLPELGLGHRLPGRRVAALPQLRAPHVHQHPRQGPRPGLRDHAHRPAPALAPGLPAAAALQPAADGLLRVGRRAARPQLRRDPRRREVQGAGASPS